MLSSGKSTVANWLAKQLSYNYYYAGYFQIDYIAWNQEAPTTCEGVFSKGFGSAIDINQDCYVNLVDFAGLATDWLFCNNPDDDDCLQY